MTPGQEPDVEYKRYQQLHPDEGKPKVEDGDKFMFNMFHPNPYGEMRFMNSTAGYVLPMALDIPEDLKFRADAEFLRKHPENPLSAIYAIRAIQKRDQDPIQVQ